MILNIIKYGEPLLKERCKPVTEIGDAERRLFKDMAETMYQAQGVGLAASQVGVNKQLMVLDDGSGLIKLANPEIKHCKGKAICEEGCLSIPDVMVRVKRAEAITVYSLNERGEKIALDARGALARIIQHECDHLQGKLIIDYLSFPRRFLLRSKITKLKKE